MPEEKRGRGRPKKVESVIEKVVVAAKKQATTKPKIQTSKVSPASPKKTKKGVSTKDLLKQMQTIASKNFS